MSSHRHKHISMLFLITIIMAVPPNAGAINFNSSYLNYPNPIHPNSNHPNLNYPNLNYPNPIHPNSNHPNLNYPNLNYPIPNHPRNSKPMISKNLGGSDPPKGIHHTIPADPRYSIAISWYTYTSTDFSIVYGLAPHNLNLSRIAGREMIKLENVEKGDFSEFHPYTYVHHITLSKLQPNTTYFYQVGDNEFGWSSLGNFTTGPFRNSSHLHFLAYGDNRSDHPMRRLVNRLILQNLSTYDKKPVQFILHMGDMVAQGDKPELFNYFFEDSEALFTRFAVLPIQGNHEFGTGGQSFYRDEFVLPENGMDEWYWSLQYGSSLILGLDSESHGVIPYDSQSLPWIEAILNSAKLNSSILWKFAFFHQPPFVSSSHTSRLDIRDSWCQIFDRNGVDIVFNGHCHLYERSFPVAANLTIETKERYHYQDPVYPLYVVTGAAGKGGPIDKLPERDNEFMAFSNFTWHYVDISIHNDYFTNTSTLSAHTIGIIPQFYPNGTLDEFDLSHTVLLDNFTISKSIPRSWFDHNDSGNSGVDFPIYPHDTKVAGLAIFSLTMAIILGVQVWFFFLQSKKEISEKE